MAESFEFKSDGKAAHRSTTMMQIAGPDAATQIRQGAGNMSKMVETLKTEAPDLHELMDATPAV